MTPLIFNINEIKKVYPSQNMKSTVVLHKRTKSLKHMYVFKLSFVQFSFTTLVICKAYSKKYDYWAPGSHVNPMVNKNKSAKYIVGVSESLSETGRET